MRGYKALIQEAELMAMSPELVSEFLKLRARQPKSEAHNDHVDEDVEEALRERGEPLIDLALARYGRHLEVLSVLFQSAAPGSPVRLACLSNAVSRRERFSLRFPLGLFGREPESMATWLLSASDRELAALFENQTLNDSFLQGLLEREKGWESIDDDKLCLIVSFLYSNPRMRKMREDDWLDAYDDFGEERLFCAAWKLAETAPTTDSWAESLGWLYEHLQPTALIQEPLGLAARWRANLAAARADEREAKDYSIGYLSDRARVRKGLARLALLGRRTSQAELLLSDDVAFRAAAYFAGNLTADELGAGYERDGALAFNEAISNLALWRHETTRAALRDIAEKVVRGDKHSDPRAARQFALMKADVRAKHPAWFTEEDGKDQVPATKADLSVIVSHMERQSLGLDASSQGLRALTTQTSWILWFSLGALVASLLNR